MSRLALVIYLAILDLFILLPVYFSSGIYEYLYGLFASVVFGGLLYAGMKAIDYLELE
ncbi:MAG: hypothetical protein H7Y13_11815 [Sphingobacteriaceae bacterium]|nr:hypothetical protein [Sphingobacteriaceae bacterium]